MNWNRRFANRTSQMRRSAVRELLKIAAQPGMISLAGGLPASELFPIEEVRRAANAVLTSQARHVLQYSETEGLPELRDWIAARFAPSTGPIHRANVLITSGAQQALDLIGRVFLDPGDKVLVENPTYLAALSAWRPLGVEFMSVPSDASGVEVDKLELLLQHRRKLLYCVPNFQNPTGTTLSLDRRVRLLDRLREQNVGLIEDDPYGELRFTGAKLPRLLDLDSALMSRSTLTTNVIHVGTFSKVLVPGLRVGWVVAPEAVIEKLVQAKQAADLHTSTLSQCIIYEVVRNGFLDQHLPHLRRAYRERRDAMLAALEKHLPRGTTWTVPDGGIFIMVTLPDHLNAATLLEHALQHRVAFVPGEEFHINGEGKNTLRLNFSNPSPPLIEEGVRRLARTLHALSAA